jgi:hypothetical protein
MKVRYKKECREGDRVALETLAAPQPGRFVTLVRDAAAREKILAEVYTVWG